MWKRAWTLLMASASGLALGLPAMAAEAAADETAVGEVVVTGMRRAGTVQNTAAVIDVISAEQIEAAGITGSMNLQFKTPGVLISQDLGLQTQVYIRGIGSNLQGIAVSNSVATYVDGVYIPNVIQASQSFNDVERVEILKGPQATLYGRNATGGAILVVSKDPSFNFGGSVDASVGNYKAYQVRASVTGPIAGDKLAGRLSVQASEYEGYNKNLFNGKHISGQQLLGLRGALLFTPDADLSVILRADYTWQDTSDFLKLLPSTSIYYAGAAAQWFTPDRRSVYYDIQPDQPMEDGGVSATVKWASPLGQLTSITGLRNFRAGPIFSDSDQVASPGTFFPAGIGAIGSKFGSDSIYHETYLATDPARRLSAVVGANYFYEDAYEFKRILGPTLAVPRTFTDRTGETEAWSAFVDGTFRVSDTLNLVGGVRYSRETKTYNFFRRVPALPEDHNKATFENTSPRVGVEWRPRQGLLVYASATSGFKSGGFNTDVPTNGFGPEKIWSYEAGVKTRVWDNRVRLSASAFYYDYKDIQVLQYITINSLITPIITNAGAAKLWGSDVTADVAVTDDLTVGGGVSYLHSEFGSAIFCDPLMGSCTATNPAARPFVNVEGNRLPRAPKLSGTVYFDYKVPIGLPGELTVHGDASYRSKTYYTVFQNPIYAADSFWMLGATIRYEAPQGWFAEAYGQNLTNELAITQIINSSPLRNPATGALIAGTPARFERYAAPRTYGVRVGYTF